MRRTAPHPPEATVLEGLVLLAVAWLTVIAVGLLAPVLPAMRAHYAGVPHRDLLIGFVATGPALLIALCAVPFGWLADRLGTRLVLIGGMCGYGIAGLAPLRLETLPAIAASRAVVGLCEAAALTAGTAAIGAAFSPAARTRWLAAQVASANIMGIATALLGGWAGRWSWRAPFWAYGFALVLLPLVVVAVRERSRLAPGRTAGVAPAHDASVRRLVPQSALAVAAGVLLIGLMVETSFLLAARGVRDSGAIGLCIAAAAIGTASGAIAAAALDRVPPPARIATGFGVLAGGLAGIVLVPALFATGVSGLIAGVGIGLVVPTLLAVTVGGVPRQRRGRAAGAFTAALALGQFLSPPLFLAVGSAVGLARAMAIAAVAAALLAILCATLLRPVLALTREAP